MKVFITGATGYIGHHLTVKLLENGYEVHALCRNKPAFQSFQHRAFHFFPGNIEDPGSILTAMNGCEVVFHLAAIAKVWTPSPKRFYEVNVCGTCNVLEAALINNIRKVVFTSSGAVFGPSSDRPLHEQDVRKNAFFTDYETSKFIAEERIQHYVRKGLDIVIVHPTKVYGPGLWTESNAVSRMIKLFVEGKWRVIPGNGNMVGNFSFIDDVVEGHLLALKKGIAGEKYILGGVNVSFNDFFCLLKKSSGKEYATIHIPYSLMMLYGWKEEWIAKLRGKEPKITRPWIKKYSHHLALSSEKSVCELGYSITPLESGLKKTLEWLSCG